MIDLATELFSGEEAWFVGGAVRDELLGRELVDLDIACRDPRAFARRYAKRAGGAPFPLSERHGAWRVALEDRRTVDFTPLPRTIEEDLGTRDFTINAIARRVGTDDFVDPFRGRRDLERTTLRAVGPTVFADDPLRLLRAVRLEDELGFQLDDDTEQLVRANVGIVTEPAGERMLGELRRLSAGGYRRLDALGLLAPLGGRIDDRLDRVDASEYRLVAALGETLARLPISNDLRRFARTLLAAERPVDDSPRSIHRFRRATEPWAVEALRFTGANGALEDAVRKARDEEPVAPLVHGDELGLPPGPEIGRLLDEIAEERAAGTITTREQALEYARRNAGAVRSDR